MTLSHSHVPSRSSFINSLKRLAKKENKKSPSMTHSGCLDRIANSRGYLNWALFTKDIEAMTVPRFALLQSCFTIFPGNNLPEAQLHPLEVDEQEAIDIMTDWVERNFTRLIEFAFYDSESENGFATRDEPISMALQEEFDDQYPFELIERVATNLELDGPWGVEEVLSH